MRSFKNTLNQFIITTNLVVAGNKIKKDKFIIFIAVIAVSIILLAAFFVDQQIRPKATPIIEPIQPVTDYYLSYEGNISKILVVSANASYGNYPYPSRTSLGSISGSPVVENGEPCIIINVTIRNDYSIQDPPLNPETYDPTEAYVFLTAQVFNGENQINATDLLRVGLPPDAGAFASLSSGENATLTLYLGTNNTDITSFQLVPIYIGGILPP